MFDGNEKRNANREMDMVAPPTMTALTKVIYGMTSCEGFTKNESRKIAERVAKMYVRQIEITVRSLEVEVLRKKNSK